MTDRPILFSAPMVRALLAGSKTQTRRLAWRVTPAAVRFDDPSAGMTKGTPSPWYSLRPGIRLWVRESVHTEELVDGGRDGVRYLADKAWISIENSVGASVQWLALHNYRRPDSPLSRIGRTVPPIHMPRWASRITLLVTDVRVQRLWDITEDDARAEGCWTEDAISIAALREQVPLTAVHPSMVFRQLWNDLHGAGAWEANPEVVALTFTVQQRNIDDYELVGPPEGMPSHIA